MKFTSYFLKPASLLLFTLLLSASKCNKEKPSIPSPKITFDLSRIDEEGLGNRPGSQVAIDYEYCIPADEKKASEIKKIDPSLKIMHKSKGRIGCSGIEWLCLGNTHQKNWRKILDKLAEKDYIKRIDRAFFE